MEHTVNKVEVINNNYTENSLIQLAAAADRRSSHPLAKAILNYADKLHLSYQEPNNFVVVKGRGVKAEIESKNINVKFFMTIRILNVQLHST